MQGYTHVIYNKFACTDIFFSYTEYKLPAFLYLRLFKHDNNSYTLDVRLMPLFLLNSQLSSSWLSVESCIGRFAVVPLCHDSAIIPRRHAGNLLIWLLVTQQYPE